MVANIKVTMNSNEVDNWLKVVYKDQIPFTNAETLNQTAFQIRRKVVTETYREAFTIKKHGFPSFATNVKKAHKKQRNPFVRIGNINKKVFQFLNWHAEGGTKKSFRSSRIAVPSRDLQNTYSRTGIPKAQKPGAVRKKKGAFIFLSKKKKIPILAYRKVKRGKKGKSGDLEIKYIFIKRAKIDKELDFYEDANSLVNKMIAKNWKHQFTKAIRSAR